MNTPRIQLTSRWHVPAISGGEYLAAFTWSFVLIVLSTCAAVPIAAFINL